MSSSLPPEIPTPPATPDRPPTDRRTAGRRPVTLRTKLIAGFVGVIVVVCAVIGVVTEVFLSNYLVQQVDSRIAITQDRFPGGQNGSGNSGTSGEQPTFGPGTNLTTCTTQNRPDPDGLFACVQDGAVATGYIKKNYDTVALTDADRAALLAVADDGRPVTVSLSTGEFRVAAKTTSGGITLINGASLDQVSDTQVRLGIIMAVVAGGAILIGGGLVFFIVRRSVRPLERVAATARAVSTLPLHTGEVDLSVRVPPRDTDTRTEIGQVGAALNQMLGHVSGALESRQASETRVRQFVADASHELRTPLAAIRGYAELARRGEQDPGTVGHALRRVESESARMTTLVEDLLLLARLDSGRPLAQEEVDLTMLLVDRMSDARVAGPDHRWQLDLPEEPVTVVGDGARLHQVVANLLTNARNHTPAGTLVTASVREYADAVEMTVTDNGPGIPDHLQPEIFGRFVRGDSSRSRAAGSTGLGLAIVAAVVSAHGGTVRVDSRPGLTRATVRLPRG
ncbi:HAMP domain-containing protein [Nakamurella sp. YIM 132087]|uniref:histidine kinase n=1 Tax=Nakamurella alba TaxID=2665158 RepID=A0A7K1FS34_9ACTN|nr:HAMP domain-containing sensor histidine kinase [Nakamurella alba]MTD16948.1 HAMP domain-containing protein [Nakamurella alba]